MKQVSVDYQPKANLEESNTFQAVFASALIFLQPFTKLLTFAYFSS